jgi:hypothetical protein
MPLSAALASCAPKAHGALRQALPLLHLATRVLQAHGVPPLGLMVRTSALLVCQEPLALMRGRHPQRFALHVKQALGVLSVEPVLEVCVPLVQQAVGVTEWEFQAWNSATSALLAHFQRAVEQPMKRLVPNARQVHGAQIKVHPPFGSACIVLQASTTSCRVRPRNLPASSVLEAPMARSLLRRSRMIASCVRQAPINQCLVKQTIPCV